VSLSDAEVIRSVRSGDIDAFALLVDRYHDLLGRYALHLLGDRSEAEEAVQDAFVRAFRALPSYEEREKFRPWLLRILVNRCRSVVARRRTEIPLDPALLVWEPGEQVVDVMVLRDELSRALAQLPADQREAVVLRFAEDLSFEDMSAVTGAGVSALKMRVRRACERLRALLEESRAQS
jgi:RNA polymerase sigma-70 factor (ECF subfamily)